MHVAILGRQPALGMAELEQLYGASGVQWFSDNSACIDHPGFDFERLAGSQKAGRVVAELRGDWRQTSTVLVNAYVDAWQNHKGKITLGISAYGFHVSPRDVQKAGIVLKAKLKKHGVSLRLIPNNDPALSTATSHHNKLGLSDNHIEILIVRSANGKVLIAESVGSQNITALARRDQGRPKRDAFVGMLPPKLARMMVNLSGVTPPGRLLDPFCGTGVLLQEAALVGFDVYGTDLSPKMIEFSQKNLEWLSETHHTVSDITLDQGDAMTHIWEGTISAVIAETYLGQPFSAPPSPSKLVQVRDNCDHIISTFLKNLAPQIPAGTPVCLAIPAWRDSLGHFTHLPLTGRLTSLGFSQQTLEHVRREELIYYREDQVVARQLLILKKG